MPRIFEVELELHAPAEVKVQGGVERNARMNNFYLIIFFF